LLAWLNRRRLAVRGNGQKRQSNGAKKCFYLSVSH
jgi:hypothetical protein